MLEGRGYRLGEALKGEDAVKVAATERPDLIPMELRIPLLDGFGATRRMREVAQRGVRRTGRRRFRSQDGSSSRQSVYRQIQRTSHQTD